MTTTDRELEARLHAWLVTREPGMTPDSLHQVTSVATASARPSVWGVWADLFGPMRPAASVLILLAILAALAVTLVVLATRPTTANNGLVAYVVATEQGTDIWVNDPLGGEPQQLTTTSTFDETSPAWSPDGTQLAYLRADPEGSTCPRAMVRDMASQVERMVDLWPSSTPPFGCELTPEGIGWSPDGRTVLTYQAQGYTGFVTVGFDPTTGKQTFTIAADDRALWSPDGAWLVEPVGELFLVPAAVVTLGFDQILDALVQAAAGGIASGNQPQDRPGGLRRGAVVRRVSVVVVTGATLAPAAIGVLNRA